MSLEPLSYNGTKPIQKGSTVTTCGCCSSVTKLCPALCNPIDCSMSGFPVLHSLQEFAQTHVHWFSDATSSSVAPFSSCLQSFPASGIFPISLLFTSDDQSTGASALASVLPTSIQGWIPLQLTGLISLLSKGLSGVFSTTAARRHQFFGVLLYGPTLTTIHDQ